MIPSYTPSVISPPLVLQGTIALDKVLSPESITSMAPTAARLDEPATPGMPEISGTSTSVCPKAPPQLQSLKAIEASQVPSPSCPPALPPRAISLSSDRKRSVSHLSTVGSLTNPTPYTTTDPSLVDAKPVVGKFKVGSATAIRERRRRQQLELEEKRKRKAEAAKLAESVNESNKAKV